MALLFGRHIGGVALWYEWLKALFGRHIGGVALRYEWFKALFGRHIGGVPVRFEWLYSLVAVFAILHWALAAVFLLPGRLAPRLFTPIFSALFRLLWKMSEASCLANWRDDIQAALLDQIKVRL